MIYAARVARGLSVWSRGYVGLRSFFESEQWVRKSGRMDFFYAGVVKFLGGLFNDCLSG